MNFEIPDGAQHILQTLDSAGFEAYLVGGCVRDLPVYCTHLTLPTILRV